MINLELISQELKKYKEAKGKVLVEFSSDEEKHGSSIINALKRDIGAGKAILNTPLETICEKLVEEVKRLRDERDKI